MGRKSKLSFLRSMRKLEKEATTNRISSNNMTSTSDGPTFSTKEASDGRDAQRADSLSPKDQRLASQSLPSGRRLNSNAMPSNRWSQSESHLPWPTPYSNHPSLLDTLDKVIDQNCYEPRSSENFRGIRYEDSTSTLESKFDQNLYHSTVSQYTYSNSTPNKSLRKGLPCASTPNLRASCIISENDCDLPELPSFESFKPAKAGIRGFGRLLHKTRENSREGATLTKRATDSSSHSRSGEHRQVHERNRKTRYPSIMRLPSHETFFGSKPKPVELQTATQHHQSHQNQPDHFKSSKIHVRKPPPGTRHWFEAFDPDEDDIDAEVNHIGCESPFGGVGSERKDSYSSRMQSVPSPLSAPSSNRTNKAEPEMSDRKGSVSHCNNQRKDSLSMDESATTSGNAFAKARPRHVDRSMSFQPRPSGFYGSNLLDQSILLLSSDDDDDDVNNVFDDTFPSKDLQPRRRSSLVRRVRSTEVVGKVGRIDFNRKTSSNSNLERSFTLNTTGVSREESQGDPQTRSVSRMGSLSFSNGDIRKLRSHARQHSLIKEEEGPTKDSGVERHVSNKPPLPWLVSPVQKDPSETDADTKSGPNSEINSSTLASRSAPSDPSMFVEHRKMIEVTEEEEALLQLMRSKRASTAKHNFTEGYMSSLNVEKKDKLTRQQRKKLPGTEKPRTSAFLVLDSPMGSAFPKPPSSRSSSQAPPLPRFPFTTTKAPLSVGNGPPVEFPKRTSSITSCTSPLTLSRHRSFDTFRHIDHTDSQPGSTTASTIMPSDSVSAYGYAPTESARLPPLPGLSTVPSQLALSQALAYDSNDMFPSPSTAPMSSPSTPIFKSTSANSSAGVEIIGSDSDIIADVLPGITGRPRGETKGSSVIVIDKDDELSTIATGSISAVEIARSGKTGTQARRSRQVSDAAKDASRPTSSKSSLPSARTSIGNDVLSAWKALGGMRNLEQVSVGTYA